MHQTAYFDLNSLSKQASLPCLANSYMKLMRELWRQPSSTASKQKRSVTSFSLNELVQVIRYINPMFRGYMQHDSQVFLIYLMDQLHEELKRPVLFLQAKQQQQQPSSLLQDQEEEEEEKENNKDEDDNLVNEEGDDELISQEDEEENESIRANGFKNQTTASTVNILAKVIFERLFFVLSLTLYMKDKTL